MSHHQAIDKQMIDDSQARAFAQRLMSQFKAENIIDGNINALQAVWVHHRLRAIELTNLVLPDGTVIPGGFTVDVMNMVISGDMEAAYVVFNSMTPDDMTQPQHFLSAQRINTLKNRIAQYLGWIG